MTLGLIFEDGDCVAPAECPCEFHGTLYPTGSVVKEDCNAWSVSTARGGGGVGSGDFQGFPPGLSIWGLGPLAIWGHSLSISESQVISFNPTPGDGGISTTHFRDGKTEGWGQELCGPCYPPASIPGLER